jgi:bifunctional non-homologous end joining protein LigD
MLATLTDRREFGDDWLLEHKFDGVRCLGVVHDGRARVMTRSERDVTTTYPELARALERQGATELVVDGEVVATDGEDVLGFSVLQQRLGVAHPSDELIEQVPIALCAFDLLHLETYDIVGAGLLDRKRGLAEALSFDAVVRWTDHQQGDSVRRYEEACRAGWEGLLAKRADAPYVAGRSRDWLKLKCVAQQELVIGGFTAPRGSRIGFGALLVGYYQDRKLRYAGKVGTGFDQRTLRELFERLKALEQADSPFDEPIRPLPAGTHWVRPELVAQIGFAEWTRTGRLRQPRFLGLRDDKPATEVVREEAVA